MRKFLIALSAVGALLMLGATSAAQASHRITPGATPACGNGCFNLHSLAFGHVQIQSANVPGDNGVGGKIGQTINLKYATDSSPNEDFVQGYIGTVSQLCPQGLLSPYICNTYSTDPVYESNWAPYGNQSGLCAGARLPANPGEPVSLRPCGVNGSTLWVADVKHSRNGYMPFLNGADRNYSHPLVLTVVPGKKIGLRLRLERLNPLSHDFISNEQMFAMDFGVEF
jgi:hypothetical protein